MFVNIDELYSYLDLIARKSFNGEIPWGQPNPSTFQWNYESYGEEYRIIIQRASIPKTRIPFENEYTFLFQVYNSKTKQSDMSISSAERPDFTEVLSNIFRGAASSIDKRSTEVLRKILQL